MTGLMNHDIALTCALSPTPAVIQIDPSALEQVLLNLVINARDAVPPGGHIGLEVSHAVASDLDDQMPSGDCVRLRVRDNGSGLSDEAREHLFEPFFTTKEPGKGTGLGLASVYGIVRQSHGTISVKSEVGQGTTFTLCWPAIQIARRAPIEPRPASSPETAPPTETILLVEDEDTSLRGRVSLQVSKVIVEDIVHSHYLSVVIAENRERQTILLCESLVCPGIVHVDSYDLGIDLVELREIIS